MKLLNLVFFTTLFACFGLTGCKDTNSTIINDNTTNFIQIENEEDAKEFFTWSEDRIPMVSAHRGGRYYTGYAENSIEMFEYTISNVPAIIEFDVRRSKDGALVLMHDETTRRTTTTDSPVEELTLEEIRNLQLIDHSGAEVSGVIPTLQEVLDWGRGKVVFTVDVKNVNDLDDAAEIIIGNNAEHYAALITYSLNVAEMIHRKYPSIYLSLTVRNDYELSRLLDTDINLDKVVVFTGTTARDESFNNALHDLGRFTILGTMGNIDNSAKAGGVYVYRDLINSGSDILSTDYPVEVYNAFKDLIPKESSKGRFFK